MAPGESQAAEARFAARLRSTLTLAESSGVGGGPEWDGHLASLGLTPMTFEQRLAVQRQGVANLKGALPVEVRRALQAVRDEELKGLVGLDDASLRLKLDTTIERELRDYLNRCRPRASLGSIFANAQATTVRLGEVKDQVAVLKCRCCGAARPDGSNLRVCAFCGAELFGEGASR
ncbi:MAG: hypothetical protein ACYC8T_03670 [Myxococcaceae bacterium]